jgi:hypothetical protein
LQGREADTQNTKVDDTRVEENSNTEMSEVGVDSTETEGKTGADCSEIKIQRMVMLVMQKLLR